MDDIFNNLANTEIGPPRPKPFDVPGTYQCTIDRCLLINTREGKRLFIVEVKDQDDVTRSWLQDVNKQMADQNMKRFFCAASGYPLNTDKEIEKADSEIGSKLPQIATAAVDDEKNILKGRKIEVITEQRLTKPKGPNNEPRPYTYFDFQPSE